VRARGFGVNPGREGQAERSEEVGFHERAET
jgi:hypothetical protein